jgi:protein-S-isoprenylcysteine O-methyltransferase Ste14
MTVETPPMIDRKRLAVRAVIHYVLTVSLLSAALLWSAGTLDYWQAKLHLLSVHGCSLAMGIFFLGASPDILERRLRYRETRKKQRYVMNLGMRPVAVALYVVPGLARRFGRLNVPDAVVYASLLVVVFSYLAIWYVFWCNRFAGRTVTVEKAQKVVSTGPYAYVRHPMYAFSLPICFLVPISLGSYHGAIPAALVVPILIYRLLDEEEVLRKDLDGYATYMDKVPYRLIPYVY